MGQVMSLQHAAENLKSTVFGDNNGPLIWTLNVGEGEAINGEPRWGGPNGSPEWWWCYLDFIKEYPIAHGNPFIGTGPVDLTDISIGASLAELRNHLEVRYVKDELDARSDEFHYDPEKLNGEDEPFTFKLRGAGSGYCRFWGTIEHNRVRYVRGTTSGIHKTYAIYDHVEWKSAYKTANLANPWDTPESPRKFVIVEGESFCYETNTNRNDHWEVSENGNVVAKAVYEGPAIDCIAALLPEPTTVEVEMHTRFNPARTTRLTLGGTDGQAD